MIQNYFFLIISKLRCKHYINTFTGKGKNIEILLVQPFLNIAVGLVEDTA